MAGFIGWETRDRLEAVLLVGPLGGTSLEVRNPEAFDPLAEAAYRFPVHPRHIVGAEDVTSPFWNAYSRFGARVRWERREPVYLVTSRTLSRGRSAESRGIEPAREEDLEAVVRLSALQYREDLKDDALAMDPAGFRARHLDDLREGRWWVLRERGSIVFQVHVGPENDRTVQIGGVMTDPDLRGRGHATSGLHAIASRLLERRPAVSLFCDEANLAARRVYEKLGFRSLFHYRSWMLDRPDVLE